MTRNREISGPGEISIEAQSEDDAYADFIARQDDEEERPRQPAPDLLPDREIVNQAFIDVNAGQLDTEAVHAVIGRRAGTIHDYARLKDLYDVAVRVALHSGVR